MQKLLKYFFIYISLFLNNNTFGAEHKESSIVAEFINYYALFLKILGINEHSIHEWSGVVGSCVVLLLLLILGLYYKNAVENNIKGYEPDNYFSIKTFIESILSFVENLSKDVIGEHEGIKYVPLLSSIFIFILFCNLTGLVPGFPPATENISINLALGIIVFIFYNYQGIREHGYKYIYQFLGPVWWLAPILVLIELASHCVRPVSLSLRLYGNIFGDHLVLSVFTGLTYVIIPAFLMFFGLLVAIVQSFVFTLLSSIYISLAISHEH